MRLPLFPLSAHVLPEGRLALRVFEPRYLRMIKEVCYSGSGFGVCMLNERGLKEKNEHIYPVGTWVEICDFNQQDDGLLGIVVEGKSFFTLQRVVTEDDGLRIGECDIWQRPLDYKEEDKLDVKTLSLRLQELFKTYPDFTQLYGSPCFDDVRWVLYRWLEILPISPEQKQRFLQEKSLNAVYQYLNHLIQ